MKKPMNKAISLALFLTISFQGITLPVSADIDMPNQLLISDIQDSSAIGSLKIATTGTDTITLPITAYSSTPGQTDDTPFIMASGKHVYDGAVAANFLPLGTKIKIPKLFGNKIFVVEDRMNRRYFHRVDIWFASTQVALNFGKKQAQIVVLD